MAGEDELFQVLSHHLHGVPPDFVKEVSGWFGALKEQLAGAGLPPEAVQKHLMHAMAESGVTGLDPAGSLADIEGMEGVVELLKSAEPPELEALAAPDLDLENLLGEVQEAQKQAVDGVRAQLDKIGVPVDDHMDASLRELAGEDVPEKDMPPPPAEGPPPEAVEAERPEAPEVEAPAGEEEAGASDLAAMQKEIDAEKARLKASLAEQLAAAGVAPGPLLAAVFAEAEQEEQAAMKALSEEAGAPPEDAVVDPAAEPPGAPGAGEAAGGAEAAKHLEAEAASETAPSPPATEEESLLNDLEKEQDKIKELLEKKMKDIGVDSEPLLGALFALNEDVEKANMEKIANEHSPTIPDNLPEEPGGPPPPPTPGA